LFALGLYSSNRSGFLSYLYQHRHEVSYTLGLSDEVAVTICGSEYYNDQLPVIETAPEHESVPTSLTSAPKINLFVNDFLTLSQPSWVILSSTTYSHYSASLPSGSASEFFQPPRV
jgi:hypothetical protein